MSSRRMFFVCAAGLATAMAMAASPVLRSAMAQGMKAPDDPFGGLDLESLQKKNGSTGVAPADAQPETAAPSEEAAPRQIETLFDNGNIYAVRNRPTRTTVFRLTGTTRITKITTYHWNNGRGAPAGTIALRNQAGDTYGPWQATGLPGQGGVPSAYWAVELDITLPAGTYTVIDSNPSTWAQNAGTGGAGMASAVGFAEGPGE